MLMDNLYEIINKLLDQSFSKAINQSINQSIIFYTTNTPTVSNRTFVKIVWGEKVIQQVINH